MYILPINSFADGRVVYGENYAYIGRQIGVLRQAVRDDVLKDRLCGGGRVELIERPE